MERFFVYSMERGRPIRLIWQEDNGSFCQANAQVTSWDGHTLTATALRPRRVLSLRREQILSADYKKGDEGMMEE